MKTKPALILVLAALAVACGQTAPPAPPPAPAEGLSVLQARADEAGAVRVIARVRTPENATPAAVADERAEALAALQSGGVATAAALGERPLIVAEVTRAQLDQMAESGAYDVLVEDRLARPTLAESARIVGAPQVWALGGRGAGQSVAILDTGVDARHPFLSGRVTAEACFSSTSAVSGSESVCPNGQSSEIGAGAARPCNAEGCTHGTHVAGIAAGRGRDFSGIAPDAEIVAVQVFSRFVDRAGRTPCSGSGQPSPCIASFTSDQIRALDHVRQLAGARRIAAANMSLGGGRATTACDTDVTKPVIDELRAAGVAVVIASGNDGFGDAVSFPGCISTAVTVGATSKLDQIAPFSNRGPQVDVLAPGVAINSSVPGGGFAAYNGTSMATPHVAGAFALLRSLVPNASLDAIETALKSTGVTVRDRPRIALLAAAQSLRGSAPGTTEVAMAASADPIDRAVATFESMSTDQPVRIIVKAKGTLASAASAATAAARAAGAQNIQAIPGGLFVMEATPNQAIAIARSGAVADVQVDAPRTTQ
ncbi:MAG: S8 family serine peptidase [Hyphomonadaceae bacterium]|nr:S8 family serine peptidase [Hyphomonadaceae bacterium]